MAVHFTHFRTLKSNRCYRVTGLQVFHAVRPQRKEGKLYATLANVFRRGNWSEWWNVKRDRLELSIPGAETTVDLVMQPTSQKLPNGKRRKTMTMFAPMEHGPHIGVRKRAGEKAAVEGGPLHGAWATGATIWRPNGKKRRPVTCVNNAFTTSWKFLDKSQVIDLNTGKRYGEFPVNGFGHTLCVSPNGDLVTGMGFCEAEHYGLWVMNTDKQCTHIAHGDYSIVCSAWGLIWTMGAATSTRFGDAPSQLLSAFTPDGELVHQHNLGGTRGDHLVFDGDSLWIARVPYAVWRLTGSTRTPQHQWTSPHPMIDDGLSFGIRIAVDKVSGKVYVAVTTGTYPEVWVANIQ